MTSRRARRRRDLERRVPGRLAPRRVAGGVDVGQVATIAALTREAEEVGRDLGGLLESAAGEGLVGWGRLQRLHVERATVPPELEARPPAVPGGCYEAACLYVLGHRDLPGLALVHGLIVEEGRLLPHSFVLVGGVVFDPTTSDFYVEASYRSVLHATIVCEHPAGEAAGRILEGGGPPPWGDCDDRYGCVREALLDAFDAAHPTLATWTSEMLELDPVFRGQFQEAAARGGWVVVNVMLDLARDGHWRNHQPGSRPWPHTLRLPRVAAAG